jgi:small basic protein (TIGR04137 family)
MILAPVGGLEWLAGRGLLDKTTPNDPRCQMSMDRSLKSANALVRHRNVLTRAERLDKLKEEERWNESKSVFGLPKVANRKVDIVKEVKEVAAEGAEGAAAGTPGAPAAGGAAAAGAAKGAAPAAGAKGAAPAGGAKGAAPAAGKGAAAAPAAKKK